MSSRSTRERIITAADRLFYERGFENTSFADVSELVGISRGNFYYHFKTKDEMLDAVIERRIEDRAGMLDRWADASRSPRESIAHFIRILLMNEKKIRVYGCPVGTLFSELSKLNHPAEEGARRLFELFRIWLRRRFEEIGETADADRLALHVLARSQGAATLACAYPDEPILEREADEMLVWLDAVTDDSGK